MLIDPFTTIAQIINFLILVALLKRFLYGPITQAMTQRENYIADRLRGAAAQEADAEAKATRYRQLQQDLQNQEEERFARLHGQIEAKRSSLLSQAQGEVAAIRSQWYEALQEEKQAFLRLLWQQSSQQLTDAMRQALQDLANADLEQQVLERFLDRLQSLSPLEQQSFQTALAAEDRDPKLIISSCFPLELQAQQRLVAALHQQMGETEPEAKILFQTQEAILCGLELQVSGYKLSWSLAQYLQQLETRLGQLLDERRPTAPFLSRS